MPRSTSTRRADVLVQRLLERALIEGRSDDTAEVIDNRLQVFEDDTRPLVDYYRNRGLLHVVDAESRSGRGYRTDHQCLRLRALKWAAPPREAAGSSTRLARMGRHSHPDESTTAGPTDRTGRRAAPPAQDLRGRRPAAGAAQPAAVAACAAAVCAPFGVLFRRDRDRRHRRDDWAMFIGAPMVRGRRARRGDARSRVQPPRSRRTGRSRSGSGSRRWTVSAPEAAAGRAADSGRAGGRGGYCRTSAMTGMTRVVASRTQRSRGNGGPARRRSRRARRR